MSLSKSTDYWFLLSGEGNFPETSTVGARMGVCDCLAHGGDFGWCRSFFWSPGDFSALGGF